jgi:hypothetical protein
MLSRLILLRLNQMHLRKSINQLGSTLRVQALIWGALMCLLATPLAAQKVVVLTAADIGKVVTGTHHYSQKDQSFRLSLKHRIGDQKSWQISLQKETQFDKSPFTLKSTLPASLGPDGTLDIEFGVDYSKSLQSENTISLLAVPTGAIDAKTEGIAINIKLSADASLMFYSDRTKAHTKSLPTYEFVGPTDKFLEISWNGGGAKSCVVKIEENGRNAFLLIPNSQGAGAIASGSTINLSNGSTSFLIRYDGLASKSHADVARISFSEPGGQTIVANMVGTYQGGTSLFAAAKELLTRDKLSGGFMPTATTVLVGKDAVKAGGTDGNPSNGKDVVKNGGADLGTTNPVLVAPNPLLTNDGKNPATANPKNAGLVAGSSKATPSPKAGNIGSLGDFSSGLVSAAEGKERLQKYHSRFGFENLIKSPTAKFEKNDGVYEARLHVVKPDSMKADRNFVLHFIRVMLNAGTDSLTINAGDHAKMLGDTTLLLSLTNEDRKKISSTDSFNVTAMFFPEYESADGAVANDSLVFKGVTFGKVVSSNYWRIVLWASIIGAFVLLMLIGFLLARQPINSFRYLRESQYQRERHNANSQRQRVDVETVHIDLARRENDLIQLAFVDRGEGLDGKPVGGGIEKVRSIASNVPTPRRNGFRRFFAWLYAPFGRKREPKFKSVYYSLRVEIPRGSVPQQLRLKDESGMIMLGTTLTGNVLATDHQDFKFVKGPFHYSIYLDPSEFVDYTGAMKTVSIPFRVIEEPFEGYVMTREYNLNLEIAQRY